VGTINSATQLNMVTRANTNGLLRTPIIYNYTGFTIQSNNFSGTNNRIVIILESPHFFEYDYTTTPISFIGPAFGNTGERINRFLLTSLQNTSTLFNGLFATGNFDIILINALQYQTSLGISGFNRTNRNRLFRNFWISGGNVDLIERINSLNPTILLNCCTSSLKTLCGNNFLSQIINVLLLEGFHPLVWNAQHFFI